MSEKLLTIEEVSRYLRIPESRIRELVEKGRLPAYKIGGTLLRFKREHMEAFQRSSTAATPAPGSPPDHTAHRMTPLSLRGTPGHDGEVVTGRATVPRRKYTVAERLADFLYYNDFYILSSIIVVLILFAVFGI